ncbi:hypothetical protein SFRURICE_020920 [Spodoptera frugiperda]|uniref:SFRICE_030289 n=1 Tax=Spodoptera frugiperda TaxID=7108 RepID=A0A2H1VQ75_SPOFR|nr:hypothetical protein SFRURICE_020920 [Spodoptera frugiperda]
MILTCKAHARQEESKLNLALSEMKSSKELCYQLLKKRDDNGREFLDILNSNRKLKCETAQLHTKHTEAIEARDRLQFVVDGFSQCSSEYEQTLHDKALLEHQLHEANNQISQLETLNLNITASLNNSLSSELVSARASQSQHIDLNPVTIDLTCESDSCHSIKTLCCSNKKLKKYIRINKFITKTNRLNRKHEIDPQNLQLELDHLSAKLHTMTNKYSASEKHMREYMLAMDELVRSQSQENQCEKCDSSNVLPACTFGRYVDIFDKYKQSQQQLSERLLEASELMDMVKYNAERYESLANDLQCSCVNQPQPPETSLHRQQFRFNKGGDVVNGVDTLLKSNIGKIIVCAFPYSNTLSSSKNKYIANNIKTVISNITDSSFSDKSVLSRVSNSTETHLDLN